MKNIDSSSEEETEDAKVKDVGGKKMDRGGWEECDQDTAGNRRSLTKWQEG
jgi:hypothetical protein